MSLSPAQIADRIEAAALTLRRLPNPSGSGARGYGTSWPDVVHDAQQAYGYGEARVRVVPSSEDISRMDEAIGWLALVPDPLDRRILWMRADGYGWRDVCNRVGLVRQTCHRRAIGAVLTIQKALVRAERDRLRRLRGS